MAIVAARTIASESMPSASLRHSKNLVLKNNFQVAQEDPLTRRLGTDRKAVVRAVVDLDVQSLAYGALERHRDSIIRFGEGPKAIRSISKACPLVRRQTEFTRRGGNL